MALAMIYFVAYPCRMSVQSFDHLFMSGPMHSALVVMHCFGNLAFFSRFLFFVGDILLLMTPADLRGICITAPPQLRPKIWDGIPSCHYQLSYQFYFDI